MSIVYSFTRRKLVACGRPTNRLFATRFAIRKTPRKKVTTLWRCNFAPTMKNKHPKLSAVALIALCCLCNLSIDYAFKLIDLHFSEAFLVIGVLSSPFYAVWVAIRNGASKLLPQRGFRIWAAAFFIATSGGASLNLAAVQLMPLGDVLVIRFTSIVFTVIFAIFIIKTKPVIGKFVIVAVQVVGTVLVVQPPFIFGRGKETDSKYYWLGFAVAIGGAALSGIGTYNID